MKALARALTAMMAAMMAGGVRSCCSVGTGWRRSWALEEEASFGVEHHGGHEEWKIDDGGSEQVAGVGAGVGELAGSRTMRAKRMVYQR